MPLKAQDILLVLKLTIQETDWTYRDLATSLGISAGELVNSMKRAAESSLIDPVSKRPNRTNLLEFLSHGIRYSFPAKKGEIVRGIPTSFAAPPLNQYFQSSLDGIFPVWPHREGKQRGYQLEPLYPSVPNAALNDEKLYELLSLIDAIREGRNRERNLALNLLKEKLS